MNVPIPNPPPPAFASLRRTLALVYKESVQILRDPSSIAISIVLPIVLIVLFGYGLSLDIQQVPIALVVEGSSPAATSLAGSFRLTRYFNPQTVPTLHAAEILLQQRRVLGIVWIRQGFSRDFQARRARVAVLVPGADVNRDRLIQGYATSVIQQWSQQHAGRLGVVWQPGATLESRVWFNDAMRSRLFLVPGVIVLVMTLIGALMTALVVSREWERGTMESLFVTPVRAGEILLGKTIPYFMLGMIGLALCIFSATVLFKVPLIGSVWVLAFASGLYLLVALALGLLISTVAKNQFVAIQVAMLVTFLPAFILSGFIFDLRSMPSFIQAVTFVVPARYYVAILQTIFLAGDVWAVLLPNGAVLLAMAVVLLALTRAKTRKRLL
ncbi:MAG: ABC transporter permease [Phycisphaerales bacterium]|nr:ABC transporter permease [Phycisphaerales bacterium]